MNSSVLPLEFELTVLKIAGQIYPNTRHSLTPEISKNCICIEFKGFFTIKFQPENRPYSNPVHDFYRNPNADFSIMYEPNREHLIVSGWWRGAILSLHYDASALFWQTEDGFGDYKTSTGWRSRSHISLLNFTQFYKSILSFKQVAQYSMRSHLDKEM